MQAHKNKVSTPKQTDKIRKDSTLTNEYIEELRKNWQETITLIPKIQASVNKSMQCHHKEQSELDHHHLYSELEFFQPYMAILQGKYILDIIFILNSPAPHFFNDIKRMLPYINTGTLTKRLKELEKANLINRVVHPGQPIRVTYEITSLGKGLFELLVPLLIYFAFHEYL